MAAPTGDYTHHPGKQYFTEDATFDGDATFASAPLLALATAVELTIAAGVVAKTASKSHFTIDTAADAASDDLDDITGGTAGDIIYVHPASAARTVVLKHAVGADKIACPGARDITLAESTDWAQLAYDGTQWVVLTSSTLATAGDDVGSALASTANGLGASLVGFEDAADDYTATDVEAALAEVKLIADAATVAATLALTTNGNGASLVGFEDSATAYTATDVEAALAEVKVIADAATPAADLALTTNGNGASLVGVEDADGLLQAADVEAALAELAKGLPIELADPGDGVAIPVTRSASIGITTAASETNTLAIPTFVGQRLILYVDTYAVGDRVVTVAAAVNVANNNTLTFGAVSEAIELVGVKVGGALVWQVGWNDGVGLTTV